MPVKLKCPKCRTKFNASSGVLGSEVTCPGCGREFRAPTPERAAEKLAAKRAARESGVPVPAGAPAEKSGGHLGVWVLTGLGSLVALAVLAVILMSAFGKPGGLAGLLGFDDEQAEGGPGTDGDGDGDTEGDSTDSVRLATESGESEPPVTLPSGVEEGAAERPDDLPDVGVTVGPEPDEVASIDTPIEGDSARPIPVEVEGPADPQSIALAGQAEEILRTTCYRCHGQDGANEGGFNYVLSRERLVTGGQYVVAGEPDQSYLLDRIASSEMPPRGETPRPTPEQVETLTQWVAAGAPDFAPPLERAFISNVQVLKFIRADLNETPQRDRRFVRYFTLTHLYNAGFSEDELETYRLALTKLANSLSWIRTITHPRPIDPARTVFRIDLRDFDWNDEIWQTVIAANPYSVVVDSPDGKFVREHTTSELPYIRADWFVMACSKPPLYHDMLQVPATVADLEKKLNIDCAEDIAEERVARAGFPDSGVSHNNRLIERHDSPYGAYWVSYDFGSSTGRKNLFQHPLGPGTLDDHFQHDGGEIIFNLPNGLQGYMLVDGSGKRINKGPTEIVSDEKRPDRAVTNGVSCMSCHYGGMIPKQDTVRAHVETNRASFPEAEDILALYPPAEEMDRLIEEDADRFRQAVLKVGIEELTSTGEPVVNMALRFESDLDIRLAAAELGLEAQEFSDGLDQFPELARGLGPLRVPGGVIKREVFVALFLEAAQEFGLGAPLKAKAQAAESATTVEPDAPPGEAETPVNPDLRVWHDVSGKFQVEGELVAFNLGKVSIKRTDGTIAALPLDKLSQADQDYVFSQPEKTVDLPPGEDLAGLPAGPLPPDVPPQPAPRPRPQRQGDFRTWLDELEGREYDAEFLGLRNGVVRIMRTNGIVLYLPLVGLCKEDQTYVRERVGETQYKRNSQAPDLTFPP